MPRQPHLRLGLKWQGNSGKSSKQSRENWTSELGAWQWVKQFGVQQERGCHHFRFCIDHRFMKKPSAHKTVVSRAEHSSGAESPPHPAGRRKLNHKSSDIVSACIRRRGLSFRLPAQEKITIEASLAEKPLNKQAKESGSGSSTPLHIYEEEELERLAGLQLRDTLVRSMGVGEKVRCMLETQLSSSIDTSLSLRHSDLALPLEGEKNPGLHSFLSQMFIHETPAIPPYPPTRHPLKPHSLAATDNCTCTPEHRGTVASTTTLRDLPGCGKTQQQTLRRNSMPVTDSRPFQLALFTKRLVCN